MGQLNNAIVDLLPVIIQTIKSAGNTHKDITANGPFLVTVFAPKEMTTLVLGPRVYMTTTNLSVPVVNFHVITTMTNDLIQCVVTCWTRVLTAERYGLPVFLHIVTFGSPQNVIRLFYLF
jgi:hypothetical protein